MLTDIPKLFLCITIIAIGTPTVIADGHCDSPTMCEDLYVECVGFNYPLPRLPVPRLPVFEGSDDPFPLCAHLLDCDEPSPYPGCDPLEGLEHPDDVPGNGGGGNGGGNGG